MSKAIIITGASSGIGAATAKVFLQAGWQVGLVARRRSALEVVAEGYDNAHVLPADVTDEVGLEASVCNIRQSHGPLGCVVQQCGQLWPRRFN